MFHNQYFISIISITELLGLDETSFEQKQRYEVLKNEFEKYKLKSEAVLRNRSVKVRFILFIYMYALLVSFINYAHFLGHNDCSCRGLINIATRLFSLLIMCADICYLLASMKFTALTLDCGFYIFMSFMNVTGFQTEFKTAMKQANESIILAVFFLNLYKHEIDVSCSLNRN